MGSCSSKPTADQPKAAPAPAAQPVTAQPTEGQGKGPKKPAGKFQIMLSGDWKNYDDQEDMVLKRAYLIGQPNAKFSLRGQQYEYSFSGMNQKNLGSGKERKIRPPRGMTAPKRPLLPPGPMVVITVPPGAAGTTIDVNDPNNPGQKVKVNVPPSAKPGQKMAVPVPEKGETLGTVQERQKKHSTAAKFAMGVGGIAAVTGLAVGGVILGDHLSGGAVSEAAGAAFGDGAGEAMASVTEATAGAVSDAGVWIEGAAGEVAAWGEGAGEDIAEFAGDAVDWLGDAAEDTGDFIMNLF